MSHARIPERVSWTVGLLDLSPSSQVLEVGCGPGHAVALVADRTVCGTITGIDRSATAVARARERNATHIAEGRARIEQQSLTEATPGRRFPTIFAINVNAFWTSPAPSITALARLLQPGGTAYLAWEPPSLARLREVERKVPARLAELGFDIAAVHVERFRVSHGICVVGRRS